MGAGASITESFPQDTKFAFCASNGFFLTQEYNGFATFSTQSIAENNRWTVRNFAGKVTIQAPNGMFLSSQPNGTLEANRQMAGDWENFYMVPLGNKVAFKTCHGFWVSPFPQSAGGTEYLSLFVFLSNGLVLDLPTQPVYGVPYTPQLNQHPALTPVPSQTHVYPNQVPVQMNYVPGQMPPGQYQTTIYPQQPGIVVPGQSYPSQPHPYPPQQPQVQQHHQQQQQQQGMSSGQMTQAAIGAAAIGAGVGLGAAYAYDSGMLGGVGDAMGNGINEMGHALPGMVEGAGSMMNGIGDAAGDLFKSIGSLF